MNVFTVVGLYNDNKQVYVGHHSSKLSGENAVNDVVEKAKAAMTSRSSAGGAVLSVLLGRHEDVYGENELYDE